MKSILVFAGTSEGRQIAEYLSENCIPAHICVATAYGEELLPESGTLTISSVRLNEMQMEKLLQENTYALVIDATHPYAIEVSKNINCACQQMGITYIRMLRQTEKEQVETGSSLDGDGSIYVDSVTEAVTYLSHTKGNVFVTTGSKEIEKYLTIPSTEERMYYRILSTAEAVTHCKELGIEGRRLFAMQGPFSEEMNYAMFLETKAAYLVTKESGRAGGFAEKIAAAKRASVIPIIIKRPVEKNGYAYEEVIQMIQKQIDQEKQVKKIRFVGIGTGSEELLTIQAKKCIEKADLLFGAKRMMEAVAHLSKPQATKIVQYQPDVICNYIKEHPGFLNIVVLYSGDIGFYSGARQLEGMIKEMIQEMPQYQCERICGISSPIYFLAKLGKSWEDARMVSMHGREENVISYVRAYQKVVVLLGGTDGAATLAHQLIENQLSHVDMTVGENLSYPEERICSGKPAEWTKKSCDSLSIALIENDAAGMHIVTHGIPDRLFQREQVPMTKMEVRSISISKLQLTKDAIVYDIGAGTGSISMEAARQATEGMVYAIEKEQKASELIKRNRHQFGVTNLQIIEGKAPTCLRELPKPTHAFIGGSAGEIEEIIGLLFEKNPKIRIVINCIALDTLSQVLEATKSLSIPNAEYVQVSIAKNKEVGTYQMMTGQNPVYVITLQKEL